MDQTKTIVVMMIDGITGENEKEKKVVNGQK